MTVSSERANLAEVITFTKQKGCNKLILAGESQGCTAMWDNQDESIIGNIFMWPVVYFYDIGYEMFLEEGRQQELKKNGFIEFNEMKMGQGFFDEMSKMSNIMNEVENIKSPSLFVQGDADTEVPFERTIEAFNELKGVDRKLALLNKVDHCMRRKVERKKLLQEIELFIKQVI